MPDLLFDVTRLVLRAAQGRFATGVDRVGLEYLRRFGYLGCALVRLNDRCWMVSSKAQSQRLFDLLLRGGQAGSLWNARWELAKTFRLRWQPPTKGALLFNTSHSGLDSPLYAERVRARGLRPVYFLHDLIPITHPEYGTPGSSDQHRRRLQTMLATGHVLVLNSACTERALHEYAHQLGARVPPCVVAPLAPARLPRAEASRPLPEPYFVMLGTIEPRKNHLLLLHLWRVLAAELGPACPRLVVIGQRGWECEQVLDMLERCPALKGLVLEQPGCTDVELARWLGHAQALLLPSFAEGFGMPLVEALSMGVPVLASPMPAFREWAADVPEYLDPLDGLGWKAAVLDYAHPESPRRQQQLQRIQGWQAPTWEAHFERVEALLDRVFMDWRSGKQ